MTSPIITNRDPTARDAALAVQSFNLERVAGVEATNESETPVNTGTVLTGASSASLRPAPATLRGLVLNQ